MGGIKYKAPKGFKKRKRRIRKTKFMNVGQIERKIRKEKKQMGLK